MTSCTEHAALDLAINKITSSFDRLEEAHYRIHSMEHNYHKADAFRWELQSFIRAFKEIPQILTMELQKEPGFADWFRPLRTAIAAEPLIRSFGKIRDGIVHHEMLLPSSQCWVGITKLRGLKLGFNISSDARLDSELVMNRYIYAIKDDPKDDFMGFLQDDDDTIPCVQRIWRLTDFPEEEVIDLCSRAWLRMSDLIEEVIKWLGVVPPPRNLECRHGEQSVQFMYFDRASLHDTIAEIEADNTNP